MKNFFLSLFLCCFAMGASNEPEMLPAQKTPTPTPTSTTATLPITKVRRRISSVERLPNDPEHWATVPYIYSIGYEGSTAGATMIGQNVLSFGNWVTPLMGFDILVGFTKSSDTKSQTQTNTTDAVTGLATTTATTYSGISNPYIFSVGVVPKVNVFQNSWILVYGGALLSGSFITGTSYPTGSVTITEVGPLRPNDSSITETAYGTVSTSSFFNVALGPRLGTEVFIKSLPHVSIGFLGGMVTSLLGDQTTTTQTRTASYTVVDGVRQTPTSESDVNTITKSRPGISGATVALAGQVFNLFGSFSIRYVW